jgi:RimJ/RimL family protein N-acetyltransferase
MADPLNALKSLQEEMDAHNPLVQPIRCERDKRLFYLIDEPSDGVLRLSYLRKNGLIVTALVQFIEADNYNGLPCYSIGYAVPDAYRGRGWAKDVVVSALAEFKFFARHRLKRFYVEAVVSTKNIASQHVATAALGNNPKTGTDQGSGLPVFQYLLLVD